MKKHLNIIAPFWLALTFSLTALAISPTDGGNAAPSINPAYLEKISELLQNKLLPPKKITKIVSLAEQSFSLLGYESNDFEEAFLLFSSIQDQPIVPREAPPGPLPGLTRIVAGVHRPFTRAELAQRGRIPASLTPVEKPQFEQLFDWVRDNTGNTEYINVPEPGMSLFPNPEQRLANELENLTEAIIAWRAIEEPRTCKNVHLLRVLYQGRVEAKWNQIIIESKDFVSFSRNITESPQWDDEKQISFLNLIYFLKCQDSDDSVNELIDTLKERIERNYARKQMMEKRLYGISSDSWYGQPDMQGCFGSRGLALNSKRLRNLVERLKDAPQDPEMMALHSKEWITLGNFYEDGGIPFLNKHPNFVDKNPEKARAIYESLLHNLAESSPYQDKFLWVLVNLAHIYEQKLATEPDSSEWQTRRKELLLSAASQGEFLAKLIVKSEFPLEFMERA